jgi:glyoxylate utilization-related uncharacterized protein
MSANAYFISPNRALRVANENGPVPLNVHHLPPMMQAGIRRNALTEMILFVEEGIVEFMIGGATGFVTTGGFIRIPADTLYSFRNAGDETAKLVTRKQTSQTADSAA